MTTAFQNWYKKHLNKVFLVPNLWAFTLHFEKFKSVGFKYGNSFFKF